MGEPRRALWGACLAIPNSCGSEGGALSVWIKIDNCVHRVVELFRHPMKVQELLKDFEYLARVRLSGK